MAFVYGDRVKETSVSSGTGPMILAGPTVGFQSFAVGVGVANECFYGIVNTVDDTWEMGRGTVGPGTLSRDVIISSTNSNLIVNFAAGQKIVYTTVPRDFYEAALDTAAHQLIDHTSPPFSLMSETDHEAIDHTAAPFGLLPTADLPAQHELINHTAAPYNLLDPLTHQGIDHKAAPFNLLDETAHQAINHLAAPYNLLDAPSYTALHVVTDHSLIPTHPTPQGMGSNILLMTGDLVLTNSSATFQILDPNGAHRRVTLPVADGANPAFRMVNTGTFYIIDVVDAAGETIWNISPDESVKFIPDGVSWRGGGAEKYSEPMVAQTYQWGGGATAWNFLRVNQARNGGHAGSNPDNVGAYAVMHTSGLLDQLTWITNDPDGEPWNIFRNGVDVGAWIMGKYQDDYVGNFTFDPPISVSPGQRLAIRPRSNTGGHLVSARIRSSTHGYIVPFGGDITADGAFYKLYGDYFGNTSSIAEDTNSSIPLIGDGNLVSVAYAIGGASPGDVINVVVNGVPEAVVLSGSVVNGALVGVQPLTSSFTNGQWLAVQGLSAASLGDGVITVLTDLPGEVHGWKGNVGSIGEGNGFYRAWTSDSNHGSPGGSSDSINANVIVRRRGRVLSHGSPIRRQQLT